MAGEKKIAINDFTESVDTDSADQFVSPKSVRSMTNMRVYGSGRRGVATSILGNTIVANSLPAGINKCIGWAANEEQGKLYYFNWNSAANHGIYFYDIKSNTITQVLLNLTDTNGVDILHFDTNFPIYHADVIQDDLLYWCDGLNKARKTNILRCIDKSATGYGTVITEDFITAYKQAPVYSPTWAFITDLTKSSNYLYGIQFKMCYRFYYFDNEQSDCSPYSDVPLPPNESYLGVGNVSFNNNAIEWSMETGSRDVTKIELLVKINDDDWASVIVLNKADLNIPDYSTFIYTFFNDGPLVTVDQDKVLRPYSFLPKNPKCQSFLNRAMSYSNFKEGLPVVHIDADIVVTFKPFYLPSGTTSQLNHPAFTSSLTSTDEHGGIFNSWFTTITHFLVGADVKKGNVFFIQSFGGNGARPFTYTATNADTASTVASRIKQWLRTIDAVGTGTVSGESAAGGNAAWDFTIEAHEGKNAITFATSVTAVNFSTLLDNGLSINTIKQGASRKYGIIFYDDDGVTSDTYTANSLLVRTPFETEFGADGITPIGLQQPLHTITITSLPPTWAKYFSIVRTNDTATFIQLLIQQVVTVEVANEDTYLDMIVGSLFTYQQIHPDTILKYEFQRGDRLRLISNEITIPPTPYTPYFETEVLSYSDNVLELVNANITVANPPSNNVTPSIAPDAGHVGKFIIINDVQRLITGISGADYVLDQPLVANVNYSGGTASSTIYPNYSYRDTRGIVRIKKPPATYVFADGDQPLVEIYRPEQNIDNVGYLNFKDFQQKYPIKDGAFTGNIQSQDPNNPIGIPCIIQISQGDAYVRNRAMPTNNDNPNPQVIIDQICDPNFSDFYQSNLYGTGRVYPQDQGFGIVDFTQRVRFSNNYIQGTRINGLNDFDNLDRKDYNDQYGAIILSRMRGDYVFFFKALKTTWSPVSKRLIQDNSGTNILSTSSELLNDLQYSAWEGGIGDNPESWLDDGSYQKYASSNSGVFIRIAQDGSIPISSLYLFDKKARDILSKISKNNVKMGGAHDRLNGEDVWAIPAYIDYIFNGSFFTNDWKTALDLYPSGTTWAIVAQPAHATATVTGNQIAITGTSTLGNDFFTFQGTLPDSSLTPVIKFCFTVIPDPNPVLIWVIDSSTVYCNFPDGENDGQQGWEVLDEKNVGTGVLTGRTMPNGQNISPDAIVPNTAAITYNANSDIAPSGGSNGDIWYNGLSDLLYKKVGGAWVLLVNKVVNTNYVPTVENLTDCPLPPPPTGNFTAMGKYGGTIVSVLDGTGSGVPAGYNPCNLPPDVALTKPYTTLTVGTYQMVVTGVSVVPGHIYCVMVVNGVNVGSPQLFTHGGAYTFTLGTAANDPDIVVFTLIYM
jgi:hypothetical protein